MAIGHFNVSDSVALKAIFESAQELNLPIIIGTSEGEADFLDREVISAMVKKIRENDVIKIEIINRPLAREFFGRFRGKFKKSAQELKDEARRGWD